MNILIVTLTNFGDVVLTTPVIAELFRDYPQSFVTVVASPRAKAVLECETKIGEIVLYDKNANFKEKLQFIKTLRRRKYDVVIDFKNSAIPMLVSCEKRTSFIRRYRETNMRSRHWEMFVKTMGGRAFPPEPKPFDKRLNEFRFFNKKDDERILKILTERGISETKNYLAASVGAANVNKRWDADYFAETLNVLQKKINKPILFIGVENERAAAEYVAKKIDGEKAVFCGDLNFAENAALISRSGLLLSNDSANMHIGFELGVATIGLFGPTNFEQYGHKGDLFRIAKGDSKTCGCGESNISESKRKCFHGLTPEQVLPLAYELLNIEKQ